MPTGKQLIGFAGALLALAALADESGEVQIIQKNRTFSSEEIVIKPGGKIAFKNDDEVTHNVFSVSKINPFTILVQKPGESSSVTFKDEGETEVRCAIHPKMKLKVIVKN